MKRMRTHKQQRGAALVVGLILLVVVTVLAISGMNTATTELAMARNDVNYENAFQAAEWGLEVALTQEPFNTFANVTVNPSMAHVSSHEFTTATISYETETISLDEAFSIGSGSSGGMSAYHFQAVATGQSLRDPGNPTDRDSTATHTQAFYVLGPTDDRFE